MEKIDRLSLEIGKYKEAIELLRDEVSGLKNSSAVNELKTTVNQTSPKPLVPGFNDVKYILQEKIINALKENDVKLPGM